RTDRPRARARILEALGARSSGARRRAHRRRRAARRDRHHAERRGARARLRLNQFHVADESVPHVDASAGTWLAFSVRFDGHVAAAWTIARRNEWDAPGVTPRAVSGIFHSNGTGIGCPPGHAVTMPAGGVAPVTNAPPEIFMLARSPSFSNGSSATAIEN